MWCCYHGVSGYPALFDGLVATRDKIYQKSEAREEEYYGVEEEEEQVGGGRGASKKSSK